MQQYTDAVPRLELRHASKSFGRVRALSDGELVLWPGQVHALLGENGAGKSTLVKILAGVHQPDTGELTIDGAPRRFATPAEARDAGLAVIYQEPTLFFDLSIAENIFMGRQPVDRVGRIRYDAMRREVDELLVSLGVDLRADRLVRGLSIADQQVIEIAKALSLNARVLIMDEPTAALSLPEVERLFTIVRKLRERDVAILFITHRLDEVFALTQHVTIMRDGAKVFDAPTETLTTDAIVAKMVGRDLETFYPKADVTPGEVRLAVRGLTRIGVFKDISFDVRAGEIVALAGLVGAGRSEVARAIFGIDPFDAGTISIVGKRLAPRRPAAAVRAGLALVPEDRRQQGLALELSIARNASLTVLGRLVRHGLISSRSETQLATKWGARLRLKADDPGAAAGTLSGGNQQKVVLGKWLATNPKVLIIDEPTRGIDVGAKAEVYGALAELVRDGMAVLMISSELPEVLGMADRVLVMHEGRISAEIARADASEERIMSAALGQKRAVRAGRMMRHSSTHAAAAGAPVGPRVAPRAGGFVAAIAKSRESTLFIVLLLLIIGTSLARPQFLNLQNLRDVLLNVSIVGLLTAGMTVVILMRHIDLSIGSTVGISAYAVGSLYVAFPQMPVLVALAAGVVFGLVAGSINALLVAVGRVPSLVATLSTLYIFRGADYAWVHGGQINATSLPDAFSRLATGTVLGVPALALIAAAVLFVLAVYLKHFRGGREHYAIGSNPEAARLAGVNVERRVMAGFLLSGAIAGFAGALWLARFGTVDASTAKGIELQVVAAAVVGSVAITGGVGTILGATLGALVLGVISIALVVLHVSPFWEQAIEGALIVAAIAADTLLARSVAKRMMRKRDHG